MTTKEELQASTKQAEETLRAAQNALHAFETAPENNVFESLEEAEGILEDRLLNEACQDCEGSYNCGAKEYTQEFIVGGKRYLAKLAVEYNRHDKTYYYVDDHTFTVKPLETE